MIFGVIVPVLCPAGFACANAQIAAAAAAAAHPTAAAAIILFGDPLFNQQGPIFTLTNAK
jgi:hypothetical protein